MRRILTALLLLILAASCADDGSAGGAETATAGDSGGSAAGQESSDETSGRSDGTDGVAPAGASVDDGGALGSAGDALLSSSVPVAVIELDHSDSAQLHTDALDVLAEELREHGAKDVGPSPHSGTVPADDVYTAAELRAITETHRGSRSESGRVAVYVLVLEGRYEDERVTGVAFGATSFAIFPEQISGGVLGLNPAAYEEAVLVHELGHLFGLVDLTGVGDFHEDPEHPGHARSEGSVMYWAVEDVSITNVFRGGPPREFDDADRTEMSRIRNG